MMAKKYRLQHRKHTGKLLHHRHTHYPALVLLALMTGALVFLTGRLATADDLLVNATVPAPIPSGAPAFTSPADGTVLTNASVDFQGTCPVITPSVIIALYEGSTLLGSGPCSDSGTFEVMIGLSEGSHSIVATVTTITNDTGASSPPLHITYQKPATPAVPHPPSTPSSEQPITNNNSPAPGTVAPLDIIVDQPYITYSINTVADWQGHFTGGTPPYRAVFDWGDGTKETFDVSTNDLQTFSHRYKAGQPSYMLRVTLTDENGLSLTREYSAVRTGAAPVSSHTNTFAVTMTGINPFIAVYIVYSALFVAMLLMWRYEHRHYPHVIGVPLRYSWQRTRAHAPHSRKR